jgi:hypothetical protein
MFSFSVGVAGGPSAVNRVFCLSGRHSDRRGPKAGVRLRPRVHGYRKGRKRVRLISFNYLHSIKGIDYQGIFFFSSLA